MSHTVHSKLTSDVIYETASAEGQTHKVKIEGHHAGKNNVITDLDAEHLAQNNVFKLHQANGFVSLTKDESVTEEVPLPIDDPKDENIVPVGSDKYPADTMFTLEDDTILTIDEIVTQAFTTSELSVEDWNGLKPAPRTKLIKTVIDALPLKGE